MTDTIEGASIVGFLPIVVNTGGGGGTGGAVASVNGQIGVVSLSKADVGLDNVDNTSDSAKPVSIAQQTALNLKADATSAALASVVINTTNGLTGGGDLSASRTITPTYGTTAGTFAQGNDSRITGAVQASTKGAANGVAGLDASAHLSLALMAPGGCFTIYKSGANWQYAGATITSRPSARTDLTMISISTDGTAPSFGLADTDLALAVPTS